ncbi:outer membrane protein assembly factor BamB family protein, partial [Streptomyces sp. NPDC054841]
NRSPAKDTGPATTVGTPAPEHLPPAESKQNEGPPAEPRPPARAGVAQPQDAPAVGTAAPADAVGVPALPPGAGSGLGTLALGAVGTRATDRVTAPLGVPRARPAAEADVAAPGAGAPGLAGWLRQPDSAPPGNEAHTAAPKSALTASVLAAKAGAERRAVLAGAVAGAVGLVVGGGLGLALGGGDGEAAAPAAAGPVPAAKPVPGVPPTPLWAYQHPTAGSLQAAAWRDRVFVVTDARQSTGVDLRTGRRLWTQPAAAAAHRPVVAGDSLFVIGATHFVWLSPQDGTVRHRVPAPAHVSAVAAAEGPVVWFTGTAGSRTYLFAYDVVARKELWRAQVPNGRGRNAVPRYQGVAVRPDGILVRQDSGSLTPQQQKVNKGRALFALYDRSTGSRRWGKYFGAVHQGASVSGGPSGRLYAAADDGLHAYDTGSGKHLWRAAGASGEGVVQGDTLYVPTAGHQLLALDAATGATRWTQSTEAGGDGRPRVLLPTGGRTALVLESTQVTAFAAADGSRLWKFQDAGGRAPSPGLRPGGPPSGYRGVMAGGTAVVWRDRTFYALPAGR